MDASQSLANDVGYLVKEAQSLLHARMDDELRPLDLTVSQYACLESLRRSPGITSSELARRAFVSRQSMNVLLHSLSERGLVSRADTPGPRKQIAAELTDSALPLLQSAQEGVDRVVVTMTRGMDAATLATLRDGLAALRTNLASPPHTP